MNARLFVALASLCAMGTLQAQEGSASKCALKRLGAVDLTLSDHVYVPMMIGEHAVTMTLQTSAAYTSLAQPTVEELGLRVKPPPARDMKGTSRQYLAGWAVVDSFSIGGVHFGNAQFAIVPDPYRASPPERPAVGFLGVDVLSSVDFELDLAHHTLTFYSPDHCPGNVVYWAKAFSSAPLYRDPIGTLYVPLTLDGKVVEAGFNTDGSESMVDMKATRLLYGFDETSADIQTVTDPSGKSVAHYRAMKLTTQGLTVTNANIRLISGASKTCSLSIAGRSGHAAGYTACYGVHPLNLGRSVLEKLRIYFSVKEQAIYFTPWDATP
jgi:hypothetical protein